MTRTWGRQGVTPVIPGRGRWRRHSAIGLLICTPSGHRPKLFLRIVPGSVTKVVVARSLRDVQRHIPGRLLLVWDRLAAHRAKLVADTLRQEARRITTTFFPPYAPELNPVEYFWSASKRKDLGNVCPDGIADLDARLRRSARRYGRDEEKLRGFLTASGLFDAGISR